MRQPAQRDRTPTSYGLDFAAGFAAGTLLALLFVFSACLWFAWMTKGIDGE